MDQWFFKITNYSEDLLKGLEGLERWPEKVRTMQSSDDAGQLDWAV